MGQEEKIINREAADKTKGFRLQKLRMIELLLDELESDKNIFVYGAVELFEDVFIHSGSTENSDTKLEEDKNYNPDSSFTINHPIVLNTFVSFIDLWLFNVELDPNARFVFYSTNKIGKEKETTFSKSVGIKFPKEPILKLLQDKKYSNDGLIEIVKANVTNEFKKQYKSFPKKADRIDDLSSEDWMKFLSKIDWSFNQFDDKTLKTVILDKVQASKYFNSSLLGKEEIIFNEIMELIDERQSCKNFSDRVLNCSDLKNVFLKAELGKISPKTEDFVWKQWEKLTPPETRNLEEKIQSVSESYSDRGLRGKNLKASRGLLTAKEYEQNKNFLSIRYRIYEACSEKILDFELNNNSTETEINEAFKKLITFATEEIDKLKVNYNYFNICREDIIEGIVYELFESCFLAFD